MNSVVNRSSRRREHHEPTEQIVALANLSKDAPKTSSIADVPADPALSERVLQILVASENNCPTIRACLKSTPYRVEEAEDADIALKKFKLGRYDLVLLETHQSLVKSYRAVCQLRKWEVQQGLPSAALIALIPATSVDDKYQVLGAAHDDYITTPFSERSLRDAIQTWTSPVDQMALGELRALDTPGEESLLDTLINQFVRDLDSRLTTMRRAVSARDAPRLQITAHTLRGSCGHFGAHRMARLCACLERDSGEINAHSSEVVTELEVEAIHVRLALVAEIEKAHRVTLTASYSMRQAADVSK